MGAVLVAVSTSPSPSSDAMSVMRDDMILGAWRDSGSPLDGRWKEVVADGSGKVKDAEEVMLWFRALPGAAGFVRKDHRILEALGQG